MPPCNSDWPELTETCEHCGRKFSSEHFTRADVALKMHQLQCKPKRGAQ